MLKKFVCLLMIAIMVMSFSAYALVQYEVCPDCNGRLSEGTYTETDTSYDCGASNCKGRDKAVTKWGYLRCGSCSHEEEWPISTTITYRH